MENPCNPGTFNNATMGRSIEDCIPAPPGSYVSGEGNSRVTGKCAVGYYCKLAAVSSTPTCESAFCETGGPCEQGFECPGGSAEPVLCSGNYLIL